MPDPTRILIGEDDPDTATAIAAGVAAFGCTPVIATTLPEGMLAALSDPAVIVPDRMLPGGDGVDPLPRCGRRDRRR